ncbi:MAG: plasmid mobilization relaxosome protein MobC [Clostridia bacterium]|nr:plasmid mobilization relaxosome protein MobC [Clostridia bacterium]
MEKRTNCIILRLSQKELDELNLKVSKSVYSREEFIRQTLAGAILNERPSKDLLQVIKQLQYIGNNMNQIAMRANAINMIDALSYRNETTKLQLLISDLVTGDFEWR